MAIINWNGVDIPPALRDLPAGRYVVESVDEAPLLSEEEEHGIVAALESLRAGRGLSHEQVRVQVAARLRP